MWPGKSREDLIALGIDPDATPAPDPSSLNYATGRVVGSGGRQDYSRERETRPKQPKT
jgi:hypothetical protein